MSKPVSKNLAVIVILFTILIAGIVAAVSLNQQPRKDLKAATTSYSLLLYPTSQTMAVGESKTFELRAVFTNPQSGERLDYSRTELSFSNANLEAPASVYIDTSVSGFEKIFRVDGPTQINASGKIVIELGAKTPGTGPSTGAPLTLARIILKGKAVTSSSMPITIGTSQMVNNQSVSLPIASVQGSTYQVTASSLSPTAGPTTAGSCVRGALGNLDCSTDGCIDTSDFELFRQGYGHLASSLSVPSNHHTPDLIVDSTGYVDTADYNILFQNFGTCSQ